MSKLYIIALSAAVCLYFSACKSDNGKDELAHHHHHEHAADDHDHHHDHDHEGDDEHDHEHEHGHAEKDHKHAAGEITLEPEMAERFGVTTEKVAPSSFSDAIKVSGEILSSPTDAAIIASPSSGILSFRNGIVAGSIVKAGTTIAQVSASGVTGGDQNLAAKASFEAAKRELDRLRPLYEERLVTASEYNAALRAYEEAKAGYSTAATAGNITSPISGVITSIDANQGQYVDVGAPIATVSASTRLTLRADVPQRYYNRIGAINDALVALPYSDTSILLSEIGGKRITATDALASTAPGYIPVYFSFDNDGSFIPGASADIYLRSADSADLISVPLTALSEQQGQFYVFVRLGDECYRKQLVTTGRNNGSRIEIKSGLNPGDDVVVTGTTTVRIAESSGTVPEGHSHNH